MTLSSFIEYFQFVVAAFPCVSSIPSPDTSYRQSSEAEGDVEGSSSTMVEQAMPAEIK